MLEFILKDIDNVYVRENFFRLSNFLKDQVFFEGNFEFFEVDIKSANDSFKIKHSLTFIPKDIFVLAVEGDQNIYFRYQDFDKDFIYVYANGPCVIRFIAGRLSDKAGSQIRARYPFVPPLAIAEEDFLEELKKSDLFVDTLRIEADSQVITEAGRKAFTVSSSEGDEVTTVTGTLRIETIGQTVVESNSTLRIAS